MGRPLHELTVIVFYLLEIRYLWATEVEQWDIPPKCYSKMV